MTLVSPIYSTFTVTIIADMMTPKDTIAEMTLVSLPLHFYIRVSTLSIFKNKLESFIIHT